MNLILASASPRRAELLAQVGWKFTVVPVNIDETLDNNLSIADGVKDLALRKAIECPVKNGLIIGADTVVVLDGKVLGKPCSVENACTMLRDLSGREHTVITGVCLLDAATREAKVEAEETLVRFRCISEEEIIAYVCSGEPMDKAGGYGIQGKGALFVQGITGCYFNVVGLPLALIYQMKNSF